MDTRFAAVLAAAAALTLIGCEDKKTPAEAGKDATSAAAGAAREATKPADPLQMAKDGVLEAVNDQIAKVNGYVTQLKASASKVVADQKPEFDKAVTSIEDGVTNLKTRIEAMKKAGAQEWQSIGAEVSDTASKLYNDAKGAVEKWVK